MIGKIIERIVGNREKKDNAVRPIRIIQDTANSWSIVYAD